MKPIFEYIDFRLFLADYYAKQKSEQYSFSYRQFLNKAEIKSPSLYREVVEGKRNLSAKALQGFLDALQL
ncbi:TIGR02147 family protein, partial [Fibrobacterales bacterium]|nr:TIGR02147 family protein [Fibrobacterales bacterium]